MAISRRRLPTQPAALHALALGRHAQRWNWHSRGVMVQGSAGAFQPAANLEEQQVSAPSEQPEPAAAAGTAGHVAASAPAEGGAVRGGDRDDGAGVSGATTSSGGAGGPRGDRPGRKRRWPWRTLHGVAYAGLALLLLLHLAAPGVLHHFLLRGLERAGIVDGAVLVQGVNIGRVQLADFAGQDGRIKVGTIDVRYSPRSLWQGRVEQIDVTGLEWLVVVRDGQIDLALPEPADPEAPPAEQIGFDRLNLRHSMLLVDYEGMVVRVPVRGSLVHLGGARLGVDLRFEPVGLPMHLEGEVDTARGKADLAARAVRPHAALAAPRNRPIPEGAITRLLGRFDLDLAITHRREGDRPGHTSVILAARSRGPLGEADSGWLLEGLDAHAEFAFDDELAFSTLEGHVETGRVMLAGQAFEQARVSFHQDTQRLHFAATAREPALGEATVTGDLSRLEQWLRPEQAAEARLGWHVTLARAGPLLEQAAAALEMKWPAATSVESAGKVSVERAGHDGVSQPWRFRGGDLMLNVSAPQVTTPMGKAASPALLIDARMAPRERGIDVVFNDATAIAWEGIELPTGNGTTAAVGPGAIRVVDRAAEQRPPPQLQLGWSGDETPQAGEAWTMDLKGALALDEPVDLAWDDLSGGLGSLRVEGDLSYTSGEDPVFTGRLDVGGGWGRDEADRIAFDGLSMALPVRLGRGDPPEPGRLAIEQIEREGRALAGIELAAALHDGLFSFEGRWPLWAHEPARLRGEAQLFGAPMRAEARLRQPPVDLSSADPLRALLGPVVEGYRFSGTWNVLAEAQWQDGRLTTTGRLGVADGGVVDRETGLEAERINGAINFTDLLEPRTPANQRLTIGSATVGGLTLDSGYANFHIEPGPTLVVGTTFWTWDTRRGATGEEADQDRPRSLIPQRPPRVTINNLRIELPSPTLRLDVTFEHIEMLAFLEQATDGRIRGSGPVMGRMQLIVRLPGDERDGHLQVVDGHFMSVPGVGGRLQVADAEFRNQIVSSAAQVVNLPTGRTTLAAILDQSLRDYRFQSMRAVIMSRPESELFLVELRPRPGEDGRVRGVGDLDVQIEIDLAAFLKVALDIDDLLR